MSTLVIIDANSNSETHTNFKINERKRTTEYAHRLHTHTCGHCKHIQLHHFVFTCLQHVSHGKLGGRFSRVGGNYCVLPRNGPMSFYVVRSIYNTRSLLKRFDDNLNLRTFAGSMLVNSDQFAAAASTADAMFLFDFRQLGSGLGQRVFNPFLFLPQDA